MESALNRLLLRPAVEDVLEGGVPRRRYVLEDKEKNWMDLSRTC